jgi:hypothetical protein
MPQKKKSARRSGLKDLKPSKVSAARSGQVRGGATSASDMPVTKTVDKPTSKLFT